MIDFINLEANSNYRNEIQNAFKRTPTTHKITQFSSFQGRLVCLLLIPAHVSGIVLKPLFYLAASVGCIAKGSFEAVQEEISRIKGEDKKANFLQVSNKNLFGASFGFACSAIVAAPAQLVKASKAALGVLHPAAYFKKEDIQNRVLPPFDNNTEQQN